MKKTWILFVILSIAGLVQAEVIALWENDGLAGNEATVTADSSSADLAATPVISRGAGSPASGLQDTFGTSRGNEVSLANAIANNRYFTWTVTPGGGIQMSITSTFIRFTAINASDNTVGLALFSGATGWAEGDAVDLWQIGGTGNTVDSHGVGHTVDLSGESGLQSMQDAVVFRLYYWGQDSQYDQVGIGRSYTTDGTDDLIISGSFASVPEPASGMLVLMGCFIGFCIRRRFVA